MNSRTTLWPRAAKAAVVLGVAGLLAAGATWRAAAAPSASGTIAAQSVQALPGDRVVPAGGRDSYAQVVKVVAPAVVTIRTESRGRIAPTGMFEDDPRLAPFFGTPFGPRSRMPRNFRQRGLGSGVIVADDGYVLTNHHVIDSADDIRVELTDGRSFKATLVGTDEPSDLALLKVDQTGLPTLALGDSDAVEVGDVVLAVGNPLGIGQTVTMGIVSAKGRSTSVGDGSYEDFLQTDAPINQGNSGGALVNTRGELVGINSQILSQGEGNIGIGFAIPANMARHVVEQLKADGRVRRSRLGVTVQPVTSDLAESLGLREVGGAIVSSVTSGSAAERAGVKRGDVIKSFNGQPIHDFNALRNRVAGATPGSKASVVVVRDGVEKTLTVTLDEADASRQAADRSDRQGPDDASALGVAVAPLTPDVASRAGLDRDAKGVVVQQVNPDGRAASAGIQAGDIILEVNRRAVGSVDDLRAGLRSGSDKPTLLLVRRAENDIFVTVRPNQG